MEAAIITRIEYMQAHSLEQMQRFVTPMTALGTISDRTRTRARFTLRQTQRTHTENGGILGAAGIMRVLAGCRPSFRQRTDVHAVGKI